MVEKKTNISPESFTTFGDLLRYLRVRVGLSQRDLAAKVDYHYSHLNRFEKNQRVPDPATILARFVPALDIGSEPQWVERLLELATTESRKVGKQSTEVASVGEVYRLPTSLTSVIGREQETTLLAKLLLQPDIRLLTIIGPPGVGKTRISLHVAEKISHHFTQGAVFVDLTPLTKYEMVLHALAETLGLIESGTTPGLRVLQTFLRDKNLLILMDNFEQVLDAAPQLTQLLGVAPSVKILVTSREALRVQGEREFLLKPLPTPNKTQFDEVYLLDDFPAVQLFVQRAAAVQPGFQLDKENASLIAEICRRLDGLPLAIELAAARIQALSLSDMIAQFDRLFDWLTRGQRDTPAWRQTLLGAIEWSYGLLTEPERLLLTRLAVFSGGWTLEAAEQICSDEKALNKNKILNLHSQLVDRSLIVTEIDHGKTRYRFLDTIFQFSFSKLKESSGREMLRNRHLEYYSGWAEDMKASLEKEAPLELRSRMDVENNNVHAALEWGLQSKTHLVHSFVLVNAAGLIWLKHSHFKEALEWVMQYLPLAEGHDNLQARLLYLATALSYWRNNLDQALDYGMQGIQLAKASGDQQTYANILYYLGDIHRESGNLELARESAEESVKLCREINSVIRLSMALTSLGIILYQLGKPEIARASIDEALAIAERENSLWAQSYALHIQADILRFDGNFSEAYQHYERALAVSSEIDDRISVGMELANLSLLANLLDDYSASTYYAKKSLSQFQVIGNEYQQPFPQRMLAYALVQENDLIGARAYCIDSLKGNQSIGHKTGVIASLICLATIIYAEGNAISAQNLLYTLQAEITANFLSLMEPDAKALAKLQRDLSKSKSPASPPKGNPPDLAQILNEIGSN